MSEEQLNGEDLVGLIAWKEPANGVGLCATSAATRRAAWAEHHVPIVSGEVRFPMPWCSKDDRLRMKVSPTRLTS